jgi:hypothetical protein
MLDKEYARQAIHYNKMNKTELIKHCQGLHSNFTTNCDIILKLQIKNNYLKGKLDRHGIPYE